MKILHISARDYNGGANRAGFRIHEAQINHGLNSRFFAQQTSVTRPHSFGPRSKIGSKIGAQLRSGIDRWRYAKTISKEGRECSVNWCPGSLIPRSEIEDADIINLHFINEAVMPNNLMQLKGKKIVWTLHDMWPFSGIEHYSEESDTSLWASGELQGNSRFDRLNHAVLRRKLKAYQGLDLKIACPSKWLAKLARKSVLFSGKDVHVIPNPINGDTYKPVIKSQAKELLNLNPSKRHILFGVDPSASNGFRKGGDILFEAIKRLPTSLRKDVEVLAFGGNGECFEINGFTGHYIGSFKDEMSLRIVYSAADVFVAPSRQDNLPNTVLEAFSCGTPAVAFSIGGMTDMITHNRNGYLAQPYCPSDLAHGIQSILDTNSDVNAYAKKAALAEYNPSRIAKMYLDLYHNFG